MYLIRGLCVCYQEVEEKIDKICEMASVMRRAIEMDEATETQDQEMIAQLSLENVSLRKLIHDMDASQCRVASMVDDDTQTADTEVVAESPDTVTTSSGTTISVSPNTEGDSQNTEVDTASVADSGLDVSKSDITVSMCSENSIDKA